MIRKRFYIIFVLIIFLLPLFSCNPLNKQVPSTSFTQQFAPLTANTLDRIAEINNWLIVNEGTAISRVKYNLEQNRLTAISEQNNRVVVFSIGTEAVINTQIIDIPNLRVLDISDSGNMLLVGLSDQTWNEQGYPQVFFHWFATWNTMTASLDRCFSRSCTDKLTDPEQINIADIGAIMEGNVFIAYNDASYVVVKESTSENSGGIVLINSPDTDYWWHIGKVVMNSNTNQLAIICEEGRVILEKITENSYLPLKSRKVIEKGEENQFEPVLYAEFDQTGKWLSIIRGSTLSTWNVSNLVGESFSTQINNAQGINFSSQGRLLFVATDNHIRVVSLDEQNVIYEIETPGITSLDVSNDSKLLIWDDNEGQVHIWGISK